MPREVRRTFWVLEYINGRQFMGRYAGRWTRTEDLDAAELFQSPAEAENALQSLLGEAADRLANSAEHHPAPMWWEIHGGLVIVREGERITRIREEA